MDDVHICSLQKRAMSNMQFNQTHYLSLLWIPIYESIEELITQLY